MTKTIEQVFAEIEKRFGEGSIMWLDQATHLNVEAIPTGSIALDLALGVGGIPRGRVTEIYGPESAGKTTLCQHIIAEAQKRGGACAFIDMEHALDPEYATRCGVDCGRLSITQPSTGEEALETADILIGSGMFDVVVIDSVAALVPKAELEGEMGDAHMGLQARLMSQALRKLSGTVKQSNTALIFTNQLRMKIGVMFGNPETTAGGNALKFYASVRLDIRRKETIKAGDQPMGNIVEVKVAKNKVAPPFRTARFEIAFNEGISRAADVLDVGANLGIVAKRGAFFSFGETRLGQGRENAKAYLKEHPDVLEQIDAEIRRHASSPMPIAQPAPEEEQPAQESAYEDQPARDPQGA